MHIKEITLKEFNDFSIKHDLSSYHQTFNYALLKAEEDYEYELIGYYDNNENIVGAALVLVRILADYLYAYIPEGFLIDYSNESLLNSFTKDLYNYYKKEGITFIKINPPIRIGKVNNKTGNVQYNENYPIIDSLKRCGYKKLDSSLLFESVLPRFNAIIDLDELNIDNFSKNTKNKLRKSIRKGLLIEKADSTQIDTLYGFVKNKIKKDVNHYKDYYNIFEKNNGADCFLVSIDYEKFILNSQDAYNKELEVNTLLNQKVRQKPNNRNINKKMNSDKTLLSYKNDISYATKLLAKNQKDYIAGALTIKHKDTVTIIINGYDKKFADFAPNYYLFYNILNYYKNEFKYVNLNGITGDFSKDNKYHGLNEFKIGFNPEIYEYIGEFDLVLNKINYNYLLKKGHLAREFNKSNK